MIPENILILPNYTQAFFLQVLVYQPDENQWVLKSFQDVVPALGMPQGTITGVASGRAVHFQKDGAVLGRFYRIKGAEGYLIISVPAGKDPSGKHVYLTRVLRINLSELGNGKDTPVIPVLNPAEFDIWGKDAQEYPLTAEQKTQMELAFGYLNGLSRLPPDRSCDAIGTMLGDVMLHHELQILSSVPSPARNNIKIKGEGRNNGQTILMVVCVAMLMLFVMVILWHNHRVKPVTEKATGNNTNVHVTTADTGDYADSPFDSSGKENGSVLPSASPDASEGDATDQDQDDAEELQKVSEAEKKKSEAKTKKLPEGTQSEPTEVVEDQEQDPEEVAPADPLPSTKAAQKAGLSEQEKEDVAAAKTIKSEKKADLAQSEPQARNVDVHSDNQSTHSANGAPVIEDDSNDDGDEDMMATPKNTQASKSDSEEVILPAGPQADPSVASQAPEQTADSDNQSKVNPFSRDYETTGTAGSVLVDSGDAPTNPEEGNGTSENPTAPAPVEADGASVPGDAAQQAGTAQPGLAEQKAAHGTLAQRDKAKATDFAKGVVAGADSFE
ncbi:hypothetical protein FAI41_04365 [Acetobacteraceae bacterium]|nr:hypothetical protein FAI41_04365 [Acetobacteraceae bacterium]